MMKSLITVIFVLSIITAMCENASAQCGPNEAVPICQPCSVTCDDRENVCLAVCIPNSRCYCRSGYLKKNGICVPISEC
ncbi:unnamed protein product [Acanthoscelides obtectus]|uniref:Uncharacterized protein n=1 Tax=Acanthoscelides obtectus TaxID=200917 RepID=A0A9P0KFY8_ACAOB|nr:unnamed protein product [Acanthoscelides obtectus]CAK1666721.1 hypothetical protein AOBTE_LOCUS25453 [Acanthoscelides obtectus]